MQSDSFFCYVLFGSFLLPVILFYVVVKLFSLTFEAALVASLDRKAVNNIFLKKHIITNVYGCVLCLLKYRHISFVYFKRLYLIF